MKKINFLMALVVLAVFIVPTASAVWWDTSWSNRINITIPDSQINGTVTDFPILINGSAVNSTVFSNSKSDLSDWRFIADDQTTQLNHEVVLADGAGERVEMWVRVNLTDGQDNIITLYYNNPDASAVSSAFQEGTWNSDYKGVYHLQETFGTTATESTSNSNDGTANNDRVFTTEVDGIISTGVDFTQGDDYILVDGASNLKITDEGSFSFWFNANSKADQNALVSKTTSNQNHKNYNVQFSGGKLRLVSHRSSGSNFGDGTTTINTDEWYHVVVELKYGSGGYGKLFLNGNSTPEITFSSDATYTDNPGGSSSVQQTGFGTDDSSTSGPKNFADVLMDEVAFAFRIWTTDEISTLYNNQNSPDSFTLFGAVESTPNVLTINISHPLNSTFFGNNDIDLNFTVTNEDQINLIVEAFLNETEIYTNSSYQNNTLISLNENVQDGFFNFTVFANDTAGETNSESLFFTVFHGINVTNVNEANGSVISAWNLLSENSTDSQFFASQTAPEDFRQSELTQGTSNLTVNVSELFDSETQSAQVNSSMGFEDFNFTLYRNQFFQAQNSDTAATINDFTITFNNGTDYLTTSTTDGRTETSFRNIEAGNNTVTIEAAGFVTESAVFNFNSSSQINHTFSLEQAGVTFNIFDEQSLAKIKNFELEWLNLTDNSTVRYINIKEAVSSSTDIVSGSPSVEITEQSNWLDHSKTSETTISITGDAGSGWEASGTVNGLIKMQPEVKNATIKGGGSVPNSATVTIQAFNQSSSSFETLTSFSHSGGSFTEDFEINASNGNYIDSGGFVNLTVQFSKSSSADGSIWNLEIDEVFLEDEDTGGVFENIGAFQSPALDVIGSWIITAKSPDYVNRQYKQTILDNQTIAQNFYLLQSGESTTYEFVVVQAVANTPIENALITISKYISTEGAQVTVGQGLTNPDGTFSIGLKLGDNYRVTVSKDGFVNIDFNFVPDALQQKIIQLSQTGVAGASLIDWNIFSDDISFLITPADQFQNETFSINYSISSSNSTLQNFGMEVFYTNTSNISLGEASVFANNVTTSAAGGLINFTAEDEGTYRVVTFFKRTNETLIFNDDNHYFFNAKQGISGLGFSGLFSPLTYWMFAILTTGMILVTTGRFLGFGGAVLGLIVLGFFVALNPDAALAGVSPWFMFIFTSLVVLALGLLGLR